MRKQNRGISLISSIIAIVVIIILAVILIFSVMGTPEKGLTEEEILAKIHIGDFVNYKPSAGNSTILYPSKLGLEEDANIKITSEEMNWRILDVDEETGKLLLTAYGEPTLYKEDGTSIDGIKLEGAKGYLNGPSELNRICKELYSDSSKGITARSMTIEDINKIQNYTPAVDERYAYYPARTINTPDVVINGKTYKGIVHKDRFYNGLTKPEFYTYDDNTGKTITTETPISPTADKPVLVSTSYYYYDLSSPIGDLLGDGERWLASACANTFSDCACFFVRCVFVGGAMPVARVGGASAGVRAGVLCDSIGLVGDSSCGVCPVVSLSSKLLNIEENGKDGQSVESAWNIK